MICPYCQTEFKSDNKTKKFCQRKCRIAFNVRKTRRNLKLKAIEYKGGECNNCGYNKSVYALTFHHMDPNEKDFGIGGSGETRSWETIKKELDKCILLCANCHAEAHELLDSQAT